MKPMNRSKQLFSKLKNVSTTSLSSLSNRYQTAAPIVANTNTSANASNIGDFFTNLGAIPEPSLQKDNALIKEYLRNKFPNTLNDNETINKMFSNVMEKILLKKETIDLNNKENMVPCIEMNTILNCKDFDNFTDLTNTIGLLLRETGAFIIRNVISESDALNYKQRVLEYINDNDGNVGFPPNNPQVYEIYWGKPQMDARQHPNMVTAMRFANNLWNFDDTVTRSIDGNIYSVEVPLCYVDRMRIRDPGDASFTLDCHVDGGSIERWKDEYYSQCYTNIFNGNFDEFNNYDASYRIFANMDHYNTPTNCSVFRTFQGWLSLSNCAPGQGSLQINPMLNEAMSYIMLRPFLKDTLQFDEYTINGILDNSDFAGTYGGKALDINEKYHKILCDTMVPIPEVNPGDLVLWHCDTIHKVDKKNTSNHDSSVFYIPTCFDCDINSEYINRQKEHFLRGLTPPDFPQQHIEKDFMDRATVDDLNELGKLIFKI